MSSGVTLTRDLRSTWEAAALEIDRLNRTDPQAGFRRASEWLEQEASSGQTEGLARALRAHGHALRFLGRYSEAVDQYKHAKRLFDQLGLNDESARTNTGYVTALRYLGQYDDAIGLAIQTREYFSACGADLEVAKQQLNLGTIYRRTGQLQRALEVYRHAQRLFKQLGEHEYQASTSMNLGNLFADLGQFERAVNAHRTALRIYKRLGRAAYAGISLMNIGRLHAQRGEFGDAVAALLESRQLFGRLKLSRDRALTDLYLLRAYMGLNLLREARRACRRAIRALAEHDMPYELGQAHLALAMLLERAGEYTAAHRSAVEAVSVFTKAGNALWLALARAQRARLSTQLRPRGDLQKALRETMSARENLTGLGATEWAATLQINEAELHELLADSQSARGAYEQALQAGETLGSDELSYRAHRGLGGLAETPPANALEHYRAASECLERLRLRTRSDDLKIAFLTDKGSLYESAIRLLLAEPDFSVAELFEFAERSRARTLADALAQGAGARNATTGQERRIVTRLGHLRTRLGELYDRLYAPGGTTNGESGKAIDAHAAERLERQIRDAQRQLMLVRRGADHHMLASLSELQGLLAPSAAVLAYFGVGGEIGCLVVRSDGQTVRRSLASVDETQRIARRVQFHLGKAVFGPAYLREHIHELRDDLEMPLLRLWQRLLGPLIPEIGDATDIAVLPYGPLHGLPFHAFFDGSRYAIDRFALSYEPSATMLCANARSAAELPRSILLVGVSDPSLPGLRYEVERLHGLLPSSTLLVDEHATIEALRCLAKGSDALHLTTHGMFRADNPAFSGVKMADGWMTAADLGDLCRDMELVTLSACQTGMSGVEAGGELTGLSQALLGAGCGALVASLWTADDQATVPLMLDFYRGLQTGLSTPQALRGAMAVSRDRENHPYFWAPFAAFGAPSRSGQRVSKNGSPALAAAQRGARSSNSRHISASAPR